MQFTDSVLRRARCWDSFSASLPDILTMRQGAGGRGKGAGGRGRRKGEGGRGQGEGGRGEDASQGGNLWVPQRLPSQASVSIEYILHFTGFTAL